MQVRAVRLDSVVAAFIVIVTERDENGFTGGPLLQLKGDEFEALTDEGAKGCVVVVGSDGVEMLAEMVDQEIASDDGEGGVGRGFGAGVQD